MSNLQEYSVSELSGALKRTIEDTYSYVRVRGELGRVMTAGSGHMYLDLKDDRAVISAVIWKGNASKLKIRPEQGMEMIATGRLTTFPGQSKYQIVIDTLEPAGVGALMAMFEERKKKLAAEGLFAQERKKPLPFLPEVIGVVTSPSGAVIRDILHRLRDRFPRHVLVWPTLVQGDRAAPQIAAGINGFNALKPGGDVPRPDVLIVARGGGSLEDLWCFNEEVVARAAAASDIPLISAVGHETDTTLIDFVSDRRAPTPTAAAEMAVPVRTELLMEVENKARRMLTSEQRLMENARVSLVSAARGLGRADTLLDIPSQRVDRAGEKLVQALRGHIEQASSRLVRAGGGIRGAVLKQRLQQQKERVLAAGQRLQTAQATLLKRQEERLSSHGKLLETLSYKSTLERGYTLVTDEAGNVVRSAGGIAEGTQATVRFADGDRAATFGKGSETPKKKAAPKKAARKTPTSGGSQTSLF
jgi:exodeoxyribonuclease VII large subunit